MRKKVNGFKEYKVEQRIFSFDHPAVLIFGAGASRGAFEDFATIFPPIDEDFFDIALQLQGHGSEKLVKKVLKSVWELYGRTSGISLERYYRDIETRAKIGSFAKSANQPKDWQKRQSQLVELIRRVYIHTTCNTRTKPITPRVSKAHSQILEMLRPDDVIMTFNYDLVIEEALPKNIWSPVDGYGTNVQGRTLDWCRQWMADHQIAEGFKSKITLLKLHGSLNWTLYNNSQIRLKPRPYVVRTSATGEPTFDKISILPPGWDKRIDKNPYKKFWRIARLKLENCSSLIILGYSLPETDLLAQALFAEVIRLRSTRQKYLKELHLVDPSIRVKEKLLNLFLPALGPFGRVYKYNCLQELLKLKEII